MKHLKDPSDAVRQIMRALNVPPKAMSMTLRIQANKPATLEVELPVEEADAEKAATVLKHYRLEALE